MEPDHSRSRSGRRQFAPFLAGMMPVILLALSIPACGGASFTSRWRDRPIEIDGATGDWSGALVSFEKEGVNVGVMNDDDHLYVCLVVEERNDQVQMMLHGFTLWFDPDGGDERRFGIGFPLGLERKRPGTFDPQDARERGLQELWKSVVAERNLDIRGPGESARQRMQLDGVPGVEVSVREENHALVYELKVPLTAGEQFPFGIGITDDEIGVRLETPEIDLAAIRERMGGRGGRGGPGGGGPGGGGPRGRGGQGGTGGGGRGPGGPGRPERIDLHAKIELAAPPDVASGR